MKLNKVLTSTMQIVYATPKTIRNFADSVAEKDLTWFTTWQHAYYSTDSHESLLINGVCFVRMTNIDPTYMHTNIYTYRSSNVILKTEKSTAEKEDKYTERS